MLNVENTGFGDVLLPAPIARRETEYPDSGQCSYISNARRDATPNTFVMRQVFSDHLRTAISLYVPKLREWIGRNASTPILFDGHKSHLSD
jgi:hypothetical protein